ncbi:type IV pilin protein [Variovorax ureilyticus]|uniref:Type IV pilin protein n=1 Tax=Variovorax ureilyticus TaxID=1836198 RepID=A0ABU8V920_9BURK
MKSGTRSAARQGLARGFTLLELMIALAVVAILASIAYSAYTESVRKGWRAEARAALIREMQQQERFYTQRAKYKTDKAFAATAGVNAPSSKYDIAVAACEGRNDPAQCIRLTAILRSGLSDSAAGSIWIESSGLKGCSGSDASRCWQ